MQVSARIKLRVEVSQEFQFSYLLQLNYLHGFTFWLMDLTVDSINRLLFF